MQKNFPPPERVRIRLIPWVMNIYHRIRDLREDTDLTQAQIGTAVGVSQRTYAHYESGQRMLPPQVLCALADFYHVSVDCLLERTDVTAPYPLKK